MNPGFRPRKIEMPFILAAKALTRTFAAAGLVLAAGWTAGASEASGAAEFRKDVQPILKEFCFDCHADGANKGGVAFDEFSSDHAILEKRDLWWKALRNLRAGMMPPQKKPQPNLQQKEQIANWIK